jgi:hypothetical protein
MCSNRIISYFVRKIVKINWFVFVFEKFSQIKIQFDYYLSVLAIIYQYLTLLKISDLILSDFIQIHIRNNSIIYFLVRFLACIINLIYFISNLC